MLRDPSDGVQFAWIREIIQFCIGANEFTPTVYEWISKKLNLGRYPRKLRSLGDAQPMPTLKLDDLEQILKAACSQLKSSQMLQQVQIVSNKGSRLKPMKPQSRIIIKQPNLNAEKLALRNRNGI